MVLTPIQFRRRRDFDQLTVDVRANESLTPNGLEQLAELALSLLHERRANFEPGVGRPAQNDVGDLGGALSLHGPPAVRTMRRPRASPEQTQIVVDLRDRSDGRAGIVPRRLLLDRDRRRQPLDGVNVGLFHEAEKLPRIRGQRLDVSALSFGVDRVEGKRRLARARQAGHDRQPVAGDRHVDVAEVVLPRTANDQ